MKTSLVQADHSTKQPPLSQDAVALTVDVDKPQLHSKGQVPFYTSTVVAVRKLLREKQDFHKQGKSYTNSTQANKCFLSCMHLERQAKVLQRQHHVALPTM